MSNENPPLPELQDSIIDEETVAMLFRDIAALGKVIEIIPKFAARNHVPEISLTLEDARAMLESGEARAIQVRYAFDGAQWWDTLMRTPAGARVVRIRHDAAGV